MLLGSIYRMTSIIDPDEALLYQQSKNKYDKPDLFIIDLMMGKVSAVDAGINQGRLLVYKIFLN